MGCFCSYDNVGLLTSFFATSTLLALEVLKVEATGEAIVGFTATREEVIELRQNFDSDLRTSSLPQWSATPSSGGRFRIGFSPSIKDRHFLRQSFNVVLSQRKNRTRKTSDWTRSLWCSRDRIDLRFDLLLRRNWTVRNCFCNSSGTFFFGELWSIFDTTYSSDFSDDTYIELWKLLEAENQKKKALS